MTPVVTAIVGGLLLLALGWLKLDIARGFDHLSARIDHLADRVETLSERVARIEGRLDEREHN